MRKIFAKNAEAGQVNFRRDPELVCPLSATWSGGFSWKCPLGPERFETELLISFASKFILYFQMLLNSGISALVLILPITIPA
jgi:hypothetical protein